MLNFINRNVTAAVLDQWQKVPIVVLTGPRQSGKSTLAKHLFPDLPYVNFESNSVVASALDDPKTFLDQYADGAIFDEVQRVPELFSDLQVVVDERDCSGQYLLLGSQNFLLLENISQTLAGRTAILNLLPFALDEQEEGGELNDRLFRGGYPRIYDRDLNPTTWHDAYVRTYIERDVRSIRNIQDLGQFQLFLRMCAARSGGIFDLTGIGNDCGINQNTVKSWMGILEASFVCFRSLPYYNNFGKRLIKRPKLYFWDTGLLCYLLGIRNPDELISHDRRGSIFETFIVSEIMKMRAHRHESNLSFFWQDKRHEIDFVSESSIGKPIAVEIKSAKSYAPHFREGIDYWRGLQKARETDYIVYGGDRNQKLKGIELVSWREMKDCKL